MQRTKSGDEKVGRRQKGQKRKEGKKQMAYISYDNFEISEPAPSAESIVKQLLETFFIKIPKVLCSTEPLQLNAKTRSFL